MELIRWSDHLPQSGFRPEKTEVQKEPTDGRKLFATALDQSLEFFPPVMNLLWVKKGHVEVRLAGKNLRLFRLSNSDARDWPVWVQLRQVPYELFTKRCMSCIASALGTTLFITVELSDGSLAFIVVKVPWLPLMCSSCCFFGHSIKNCLTKVVVQEKDWKPNKVGEGSKASPTVMESQPHLMSENFVRPANNEIGISDVGFVA
ncbi:hypothetical protein Golob_019232, partial [Gossypium lobatum]|nr:hypothetical protein [Gossypium lobatum]